MEVSSKQAITGSQRARTRSRADSKGDKASTAILTAWRLVDDVATQVEALRREVKRQVQEATGLEKLGLRVGNPDDDYTENKEEWIVRSVIDTFELYDRKKKGRPIPRIYAAFQISLAPSRAEADRSFYPNLAILVAGSKQDDDEWGQWELDDFELDNELMTDPELQDEGDAPWWKRKNDRRWRAASAVDPATAFVVPLVELKDELDVKTKVIERFVDEVASMLKPSSS